jgi:hypothetical protein
MLRDDGWMKQLTYSLTYNRRTDGLKTAYAAASPPGPFFHPLL